MAACFQLEDLWGESLDLFCLSTPLALRNGSGPRLEDRNPNRKESTLGGGLGVVPARRNGARAVAARGSVRFGWERSRNPNHRRICRIHTLTKEFGISRNRFCKMGAVEQQQDFEDKEIDASVDFCYWLAFLPCHFGACPFKTVLLLEQEEVTKTDV